jgi:acetylornithine deacetylase
VVPVTGQTWTADPFKLDERDGRLYARGAADMKGFIACALAFAEEFVARKAPGCFHIALTHDEETDMSGAMRLTDYLSAQGVVPAWIWIGEPTGHKIVTQHKGVAAFQTRITGVPGHSSQPDRGLNAIELGGAYMRFVQAAAEARRRAPISPSPFDPPYTTFNLGKVSGGTAENIIAENFDLLWQVRVHPGERAADIAAAVDAEARAAFAARFAAFPQTGFTTRACFDIPPFLATADNPGEKALKSCLHCAESTAVGFATEAGIFQKLGAAAVICGPGFIEQAHQGDEFVDKNQLAACVDLMRGVLLSSPTRA